MSTNETYVTIKGRLCADPSVFTTKAGAPMTKFRVAQSGRRQVQPGQWEDTEPSFYDVLAYRSLAANIGVSLKKGHPVAVHGRQRVVQWRRGRVMDARLRASIDEVAGAEIVQPVERVLERHAATRVALRRAADV